ncbi:MAG: hypothetical protein IPI68_08265 [Chitinophagaceae bacterium]|nr:hypothetical protein [Chitinophagaceae bacterium]
MEVHAHTHTARKKWTHYFWEFIMLFLAVFCGFLAENIREHAVERHREKQFIQAYLEDLKTDTANIKRNILFRKQKGEQMDSLMLLLASQKIKGHESDLYYLGRMLIRTNRFQTADGTITQLKSSGSLRLIRNVQSADSMMSYQKLVEIIMLNQDDDRLERRAADPLLSHIFNPFIFDKMVAIDGIHRPDNNPPLRSYDPNLYQDLAYDIGQIKGSNFLIENRLKLLYKKAIDLIALLKKEYHLSERTLQRSPS